MSCMLCLCVFVCVCVCSCVCICVCAHIHGSNKGMYRRAHTQPHIRYLHTCATYIPECMQAYSKRKRIHAYTHTYMQTCMHKHTGVDTSHVGAGCLPQSSKSLSLRHPRQHPQRRLSALFCPEVCIASLWWHIHGHRGCSVCQSRAGGPYSCRRTVRGGSAGGCGALGCVAAAARCYMLAYVTHTYRCMYVYVCVCIWGVCVHIHTHICMYSRTQICACIHRRTHTQVRMTTSTGIDFRLRWPL